MARRTMAAAIALALLGSQALAATNGGGNANLGSAGVSRATIRADRPSYIGGGWVCPPGFVWRNAGKQDWLCVDFIEARRIAHENQDATANWLPGRGEPACRPGLVRRDAFKNDPVCVDPARRALVHEMNLALYDRR